MFRPAFGRARSMLQRAGLGLVCVALVASCGGGVDSGGTGAPAASYASGPITGFGSVIVNGVHFDDRSAGVSDADGNARTRDDLRLGMTTNVLGSAITVDAGGNQTSTAMSIVFASEIVGPLSASDLVARTLTVLGQTVDISSTTAFDAVMIGGQAALVPGDIVEVYGHLDVATLHYAATRVERKAGALAFRLRGIVSGLDAAGKVFSIGATRISYAGAAVVPATLSNGRFVRVLLAVTPSGGTWNAIAVADGIQPIGDRDQATIKGLVSAFTSNAQFSVNGTPVDASTAQFPAGTAGLGLGTRVEVEGMSAAGVLVATVVKLISDGDQAGESFEVQGPITAVTPLDQTFVVHDVTVSYSGVVDFRNGSAADLAVGRSVQARGTLSSDGTRLQASRITFGN
ncbi:MAG TPA: DUF5666 domain-containing protein [Caldimonas sp.]|nr:DUF5666 domain-containing protein [Caldimonas sp.]